MLCRVTLWHSLGLGPKLLKLRWTKALGEKQEKYDKNAATPAVVPGLFGNCDLSSSSNNGGTFASRPRYFWQLENLSCIEFQSPNVSALAKLPNGWKKKMKDIFKRTAPQLEASLDPFWWGWVRGLFRCLQLIFRWKYDIEYWTHLIAIACYPGGTCRPSSRAWCGWRPGESKLNNLESGETKMYFVQ